MQTLKHNTAGRFFPPFLFTLTVTLLGIALFTSCHRERNRTENWTVLVYMDGDNSLGNAALSDLEEMKAAGGSENVKVIVQVDLPSATAKRYRVLQGSLELLGDLGELDMSAPQTLSDFLSWAKDAWPADRTVLILWDHGNGWDQGDGPSDPSSKTRVRRSMFNDEDNNGRNAPYLSNHRIKNAIQKSGIVLDVLGMDACTMGTIEVLYEFKDLAPILISSEEVTDDRGWAYSAVLSDLNADPGMGSEGFARMVVNSYKTYYETSYYPTWPTREKLYTIAAIRSSLLPLITFEIDTLALGLMSALDDPEKKSAVLSHITTARATAQDIDLYVQPFVYVDLVDLDGRLGQGTNISQLVSDATIAEYHGIARPDAHGISVVFFKLTEVNGLPAFPLTYDPNYRNYNAATNTGNSGDFIAQFNWDEFLSMYYRYAGL